MVLGLLLRRGLCGCLPGEGVEAGAYCVGQYVGAADGAADFCRCRREVVAVLAEVGQRDCGVVCQVFVVLSVDVVVAHGDVVDELGHCVVAFILEQFRDFREEVPGLFCLGDLLESVDAA